jgi:protein TonB
MRAFGRYADRQHVGAGAITLAVHLLLATMLLLALARSNQVVPVPSGPPLAVTDVPVTPPPPPPPPSQRHGGAHHSAAPPKGPPLASKPAVAPPAPVVVPSIAVPSPVGALPAATGAGGTGSGGGGGTENGAGGNGAGLGDDGSPPEHVRGQISDRDYPRELSDAGVSGTVGVRYRVGVDGHVSDCRITHSSGSEALDTLTCGLIEKRFRFRPARDGSGRPVPSIIVENHSWIIPAAAPQGEPPQE